MNRLRNWVWAGLALYLVVRVWAGLIPPPNTGGSVTSGLSTGDVNGLIVLGTFTNSNDNTVRSTNMPGINQYGAGNLNIRRTNGNYRLLLEGYAESPPSNNQSALLLYVITGTNPVNTNAVNLFRVGQVLANAAPVGSTFSRTLPANAIYSFRNDFDSIDPTITGYQELIQ